jgi:peptide/nickel transport system substrate-binding protein
VTPSPQLVEEWSYNEDQSAATIKLRDGVTFSDGTTLDTSDVQNTLEMASEVNTRFQGLTYDIVDDLNMTITWPSPQPTLDMLMCEPQITSSEAIEAGNLDNEIVGTGPYLYDAAASIVGSEYTVTRNPDYWGDASEYPYDKITFKVFTNETAALNALKTDQIDGTIVSAATVAEAEKVGLNTITMRGNTTRLLITDHNGEKIPALGDKRVRQAMNMVLDRESIAKDLYRGYADPAYQIFRPGTDAYIEDLETAYPFDVDQAKQLMTEAGYEDGFTLPIPAIEGYNQDLLLPYITEQFAKINITVEQVNLTGPDAIADELSGDYPVPLWELGNYGTSIKDIQDYVLDDGLWNVSHQKDAKIDELWQQILTGDEQQKLDAQQEVAQYILDEAWFLPMAYPDGFYAFNDKVEIEKVSDHAQLHPLLRDIK